MRNKLDTWSMESYISSTYQWNREMWYNRYTLYIAGLGDKHPEA